MSESFAEIANKQYTVNSSNQEVIHTVNSKQYTVLGVRKFVESLDKRVYCSPKFLAFYCKAARRLGFTRLHELQAIALDPTVRSPERMFMYLIKEECARRGL